MLENKFGGFGSVEVKIVAFNFCVHVRRKKSGLRVEGEFFLLDARDASVDFGRNFLSRRVARHEEKTNRRKKFFHLENFSPDKAARRKFFRQEAFVAFALDDNFVNVFVHAF